MTSTRVAHDLDFEEVALPHLPDVARFALSLTRDESEADDLVQTTFLNAFRSWQTFQPGTHVKRWLFTICRNAFLRSRKKSNRYVFSEEGDVDSMSAVMEHHQMVEEGLGDILDRIDVKPAIDAAVEALPEPHRSILILVDMEELSYQEAAEVLDIPVGTVRSRLFRARRKIQQALIEHARDHGLARGLDAEADE